jgi:hypothetical protein
MVLPDAIIDNIYSLSKNLNIENESELVSRTISLCQEMYQSMKNGDRIFIERKNGNKAEISLG